MKYASNNKLDCAEKFIKSICEDDETLSEREIHELTLLLTAIRHAKQRINN